MSYPFFFRAAKLRKKQLKKRKIELKRIKITKESERKSEGDNRVLRGLLFEKTEIQLCLR